MEYLRTVLNKFKLRKLDILCSLYVVSVKEILLHEIVFCPHPNVSLLFISTKVLSTKWHF